MGEQSTTTKLKFEHVWETFFNLTLQPVCATCRCAFIAAYMMILNHTRPLSLHVNQSMVIIAPFSHRSFRDLDVNRQLTRFHPAVANKLEVRPFFSIYNITFFLIKSYVISPRNWKILAPCRRSSFKNYFSYELFIKTSQRDVNDVIFKYSCIKNKTKKVNISL